VSQKSKNDAVTKILIVEDNNASREILLLRLRSMGYQAVEAQNSKEALERAEAEKPDLIFMDMGLPEIDGIKTSAMLKQNPETSHIPIVALTAWISELWREKASRAGVIRYLLKPISPQLLKQTIEELTTPGAFSPKW
jgi:CheY-like chemotaxis protein